LDIASEVRITAKRQKPKYVAVLVPLWLCPGQPFFSCVWAVLPGVDQSSERQIAPRSPYHLLHQARHL